VLDRRRHGRGIVGAVPWLILATALVAIGVMVVEVVWPTTRAALTTRPGPIGASVSPQHDASNRHRPQNNPSGPRSQAFARVRAVTLYLPVPHPVGVMYHEAALPPALELRPLGHLLHNYNRFKFHRPAATAGPDYIVMSSRGRSQPATSAGDIVLRPDTLVRSPVTGRVVGVRRYSLYCRYPDERVAIEPADDPRLQVVMIHLRGVRIRRGQRVFATLSVIGRPRDFPFRSQVDDYLRGGNPHVHIEVEKPSPNPVPACPPRRRPRANR
jgi:hypothetical protein